MMPPEAPQDVVGVPTDTIAIEGRAYGSHARTINVFLDTIEALGTTASQMAIILAVPDRNMIFTWSGGRFRPSQKYFIRMQHLLLLKLKGKFDLAKFSRRPYAKEYWRTNVFGVDS
jgi:hypothetical protein